MKAQGPACPGLYLPLVPPARLRLLRRCTVHRVRRCRTRRPWGWAPLWASGVLDQHRERSRCQERGGLGTAGGMGCSVGVGQDPRRHQE